LDTTKVVNIGVAAHITAAASGGKRFDATMSNVDRKHPSNGIWLCQNCAKKIDDDEKRFTTALLHKWKKLAESEAATALGKSKAEFKGGVDDASSKIFTRREVELFEYMFIKLDEMVYVPVEEIFHDISSGRTSEFGRWDVKVSFLELVLWSYFDQPTSFAFYEMIWNLRFEAITNLGAVNAFRVKSFLLHISPQPILEQLGLLSAPSRRYTRSMHRFVLWIDVNSVAPKCIEARWVVRESSLRGIAGV